MNFRPCAHYALMAILLVLSACNDKNDTVNIGAIYNLTGGLSSLGVPSSEGAALAVDVRAGAVRGSGWG